MSERSPSLSGSSSNVSQASHESLNTAKRVKATADIVQILKTNYGISLPTKCETRLLEACPLTKGDVDTALRKMQDGVELKRGENSVKLDADIVDQLYHLTKHRHELALSIKHTPKWTSEQFEQASELMKLMSEKSMQARQTLSLLSELAEDLALVDLDRVKV